MNILMRLEEQLGVLSYNWKDRTAAGKLIACESDPSDQIDDVLLHLLTQKFPLFVNI